jgi:hypothetical protein
MIQGNNKKFMQGEFPVASLHHPEKYTGRNRIIQFKSSYEFTFMKYLDTNPNVLGFHYEETPIIYKSPIDGGREHRYWVDYYMKYLNVEQKVKEAIIEIKPYWETLDKAPIKPTQSDEVKKQILETFMINRAKWGAAWEYAKRNEMKFILLTERDLLLSGSSKFKPTT